MIKKLAQFTKLLAALIFSTVLPSVTYALPPEIDFNFAQHGDDFGTVFTGNSSTVFNFFFWNSGGDIPSGNELIISGTSITGDVSVCQEQGCDVNDASAFTIVGGSYTGSVASTQSFVITVIFNPLSGAIGGKTANITVTSNDPDTPVFTHTIRGNEDLDSDGDGVADRFDICLGDDATGDTDGDGVCKSNDICFDDPNKTDPGICGCGVVDSQTDTDSDNVPDCIDTCPGYDDNRDADSDNIPDMCDGASWVNNYKIVQITDNAVTDHQQQVSGNGRVVWTGSYPGIPGSGQADGVISMNLENGYVNMVSSGSSAGSPQISKNGYVVAYRYGSSQLSFAFFDSPPEIGESLTGNMWSSGSFDIDASGTDITWVEDKSPAGQDIYIDDAVIGPGNAPYVLSTGSGTYDREPKFGTNSVTWNNTYELFLYDRITFATTNISALYSNTFGGAVHQDINELNHITFQALEGMWEDIYFYNGTGITRFTDGSTYDHNPKINKNDHIVWTGGATFPGDNNNEEIFLYTGGTPIQLTSNSYHDAYPQIADNNFVVWQGYDGNDYEIYLYNGVDIIQLTNNSYDDYNPQITSEATGNGYIVWSGRPGGSDLEIMVAIPDVDQDEVPDSIDNCLTGNNRIDADNDGTPDSCDQCPNDPNKTDPGTYGCGVVNTPAVTGTNVNIAPPEVPALGMTFDQIDNGGDVIITELSNPNPPATFILAGGTAYNIDFNGAFTGNVTLCIEYDETLVVDETALKLLHYENNSWIVLASSVNTITNLVCGVTTSFSPFLLAEPCSDIDGDTVCDNLDICPGGNDTLDADGDGVPDDCDAFESNPSEWADSDVDTVGDNADTCAGFDDLDQTTDGIAVGWYHLCGTGGKCDRQLFYGTFSNNNR